MIKFLRKLFARRQDEPALRQEVEQERERLQRAVRVNQVLTHRAAKASTRNERTADEARRALEELARRIQEDRDGAAS